jgi:c(7)-type cytochrome triheme protein
MPFKTRSIIFALLLLSGLGITAAPRDSAGAGNYWDLPPALPPAEYGNILINRTSERNKEKPVAFSHWSHRRKYSCRLCHFELEFNMKVNTTEITEAANKAGRYCGACHDGKEHDGKVVFGHDKPNCDKCHNGNRAYGKEKFSELSPFPKTRFGNGIDWVKAIETGLIKPEYERTLKAPDITYDKTLSLEAEWFNIPPAVFPHKVHTRWLDCNNCHPDIFNIKKKTTKHFLMTRILNGEFCGVCHLNVAFPMDDCKRCHPGMKGN